MVKYKYVKNNEYNVKFSSGSIDLTKHKMYINEMEYFQNILPDILS